MAFRKYQQQARKDLKTFSKYQTHIDAYRKQNRLHDTVNLSIESADQSKLEEWKEYEVYLHHQLPKFTKNLQRATAKLEEKEQAMRTVTFDHPGL